MHVTKLDEKDFGKEAMKRSMQTSNMTHMHELVKLTNLGSEQQADNVVSDGASPADDESVHTALFKYKVSSNHQY